VVLLDESTAIRPSHRGGDRHTQEVDEVHAEVRRVTLPLTPGDARVFRERPGVLGASVRLGGEDVPAAVVEDALEGGRVANAAKRGRPRAARRCAAPPSPLAGCARGVDHLDFKAQLALPDLSVY
jgi:hypothetical protein